MPTARPADGTFAASLNATHPIVANALRLWVCDATGSIPDLITGSASLAPSGGTPGETTTGAIGRTIDGDGTSGMLVQTTPKIAAYPFILGWVGQITGTKTPASGIESLFAIGDDLNATGLFGGIFLDDGSAITNGNIIAQARTVVGGNVGQTNGAAFSSGNPQAVVAVFYLSGGTTPACALFIDGSKVADAANGGDAFTTDSFGYFAMNLLNRAGEASIRQASSKVRTAAVWYSTTQLTDQDYIDWTADPWSITGTAVATSTYYIGADVTPGNWTTSTGSGTLTSMVSETTRDDTQYIQSALNPSADLVELEWANVQIPSANTDHTVSYVLKGDASCQALVALLAGDATTVTAWVHTALPPTFQRFDQDLSTAACDAWSVGGYAGSHLTVTAG